MKLGEVLKALVPSRLPAIEVAYKAMEALCPGISPEDVGASLETAKKKLANSCSYLASWHAANLAVNHLHQSSKAQVAQ